MHHNEHVDCRHHNHDNQSVTTETIQFEGIVEAASAGSAVIIALRVVQLHVHVAPDGLVHGHGSEEVEHVEQLVTVSEQVVGTRRQNLGEVQPEDESGEQHEQQVVVVVLNGEVGAGLLAQDYAHDYRVVDPAVVHHGHGQDAHLQSRQAQIITLFARHVRERHRY